MWKHHKNDVCWNQACPDPETETSGLSTNNTKKIRSQENVFGLWIVWINEVRINEVWLYAEICSVCHQGALPLESALSLLLRLIGSMSPWVLPERTLGTFRQYPGRHRPYQPYLQPKCSSTCRRVTTRLSPPASYLVRCTVCPLQIMYTVMTSL